MKKKNRGNKKFSQNLQFLELPKKKNYFSKKDGPIYFQKDQRFVEVLVGKKMLDLVLTDFLN